MEPIAAGLYQHKGKAEVDAVDRFPARISYSLLFAGSRSATISRGRPGPRSVEGKGGGGGLGPADASEG